MPAWLYVVLCLVVPPVWGLVMVRVLDVVDRKRKAHEAGGAAEAPPPDFMI